MPTKRSASSQLLQGSFQMCRGPSSRQATVMFNNKNITNKNAKERVDQVERRPNFNVGRVKQDRTDCPAPFGSTSYVVLS